AARERALRMQVREKRAHVLLELLAGAGLTHRARGPARAALEHLEDVERGSARVEPLSRGRDPALRHQAHIAVEHDAAAPGRRKRVDAVTAQRGRLLLVEVDERRKARLEDAARCAGVAALLVAGREEPRERAAGRQARGKLRELAARA